MGRLELAHYVTSKAGYVSRVVVAASTPAGSGVIAGYDTYRGRAKALVAFLLF